MILCGTGHRPNKLGGYGDDVTERLVEVAKKHLDNVDKVVSGMALGWDTALAIAAVQKGIPFVAAVPFIGQEQAWPEESQTIYRNLLDLACETVIVCEGGYAPWKLQERNKWMVDHSDAVLALWNGTSGGTRNCLSYASKKGKVVLNVWGDYEKLLKGK